MHGDTEANMMLAIVAAFKDEVSEYLKDGRFRVAHKDGNLTAYESETIPDVAVLEGGVGKDMAQVATQLAVDRYAPKLVVSAGFAAGAKTGMETGDLFVCDRLVAIEGPAYLWAQSDVRTAEAGRIHEMFDANGLAGQDYRLVGCLSVPQFVSNASMKAWLGKTFDVSLIDMECYWVNRTAEALRVPCVSVRAMLDPVEDAMPAFVGEVVNRHLGKRALKAVTYLSANPAEAPRLIGLMKQVKVARSALASFLTGLVAVRDSLAAP
ncbi:MAG: hypothetical protein QF477_16215 [SAR202 cluster bacterium]|jgi:nucleoside phosphorylase|nr:hypothetical protein [SAR202 cluster bacterium]MDP6665583.1 hypothetical protein [SAR202 cluster bacterium]MDP6799224.1 hypothetical protein [SAR202 cluster bacterium]|tara:strand:- start:10421 stop:11218 length:798 start_codon:yes stop_codon:yes gene_type:complete